MHDLRDQLQCVLGAEPEPDECDVGVLPRGHRPDFSDVDLACDHLMAETGHDLGEQLETVLSFVRDQDAQVRDVVVRHRPRTAVSKMDKLSLATALVTVPAVLRTSCLLDFLCRL